MAPKQPIDKLPLAVRKNWRDEWESKKPEFEERISKALGETWTIVSNPNLLYVYPEDESYKSRIGSVTTWYMEPFCDNLETFISTHGDDGKAELNSLCSKHQVEFGPQEETKFTYGGLQIKDDVLRLVFAERYFATNVSDVSRDFAAAIKSAPSASGSSAFNIVARNSARKNYDPEIEEVQKAIGELVGVPDIKLNPNFEANATALVKGGREDWDKSFGQATLSYFQALQSQLGRAGFKGDDMLQEGFQEGVSNNEIVLRVVEKLKNGTYNEVVIEDGILFMQVVPRYWWTNVDDTGSKILDHL